MKRARRIVYWVATIWLSLGMVSTGIVQITKVEEVVLKMQELGYPPSILPFLGIAKFLGVIALLIPGYAMLKEWAYAGFVFLMTGAIYVHAAIGDEASNFFGPILLLILSFLSWYFRPESRKVLPR